MALLALTARHLCADLRHSSGNSPPIQNVPDQKTYLSIYLLQRVRQGTDTPCQ